VRVVWGGRFSGSLGYDFFFFLVADPCGEVLVVLVFYEKSWPFSSSIFQCIYTWGVFIGIITWSARCDSFITEWIMPLIARVISATLCISLRWSRSCCNIWNVRWPDSVTNSSQWGQLLRSSLLVTGRIDLGVATLLEGVTSEKWIPQKDECHWGSGFLRRMSVLGTSWAMFLEKLCLVYPIVCLREFLMRWDTCLDPSAD